MSRFLSIFLYLVYKAGILSAAYAILNYFTMRYDVLILFFYGGLSLFQTVFLFRQSLPKKHIQARLSAVFQYTTVLTILMELVIQGMAAYYLFRQENDLFNLLFAMTLLTPAHVLYYFLHSLAFSRVIRKLNSSVAHISSFPTLFFLLIGFGVPSAYLAAKVFFKAGPAVKELTPDILFTCAATVLCAVVTYMVFVRKFFKARKIVRELGRFNILGGGTEFTVDDPDECGLIETSLNRLSALVGKEKENLSLLSDYLSQNIRSEIMKYGIRPRGETKSATVVTIKFSMPEDTFTPEVYLDWMDRITGIIGSFAEEYEAYPYFTSGKAVLVFGVPFYFEHQRFQAVEATQKILADLEKLGREESIPLKYAAGIYSGKIIAGPVRSKGKAAKEYAVFGDPMDASEKIAAASENLGGKLLVCPETIKDLKNRYAVDKNFRIKLKNGQDLVIHQIRI